MTSIPATTSNITSVTNTTSGYDYYYNYCLGVPVATGIWAGITTLCASAGLPASAWLLWVLVHRQRSRSGATNDVYMLNLTVMDLIINAWEIPGVVNYMVWRNPMVSMVGRILYTLNILGRPLFMACFSVDCFMAAVFPLTYMKMKRLRYRLAACLAIWGFTLCISILNLREERWLFLFNQAFYLLAVPTVVACDLSILHTLTRRDPSGRSSVHPQKRRALQAVGISLVMTVVCYLPLVIGFPLLVFVRVSDETNCVIKVGLYTAPTVGAALLPLLALHSQGRLRGLRQYCLHVSRS